MSHPERRRAVRAEVEGRASIVKIGGGASTSLSLTSGKKKQKPRLCPWLLCFIYARGFSCVRSAGDASVDLASSIALLDSCTILSADNSSVRLENAAVKRPALDIWPTAERL